ncbi:hypothetical protein HBH56_240070 [Parastagonospora nodorum]|nr:hypothetical protein HBH56_240070 [Parastagonospora nodorum]KAH4109346.1 hypothetical protein HBH46_024240 [Parastagonospora nodorum]KAH4309432.1 hypothetical protein HBI01_032000 [Parastagonospora nodorum]KAH4334736.1 hypothetical protein HBI00_030160 [Parastagonospora nodorum]KAH4454283.1 hypothetical protein HBH90_175690 [Parastagonospora nodorum]
MGKVDQVRAEAYMATLSQSSLKASANNLFTLAFKKESESVAMYAAARTIFPLAHSTS